MLSASASPLTPSPRSSTLIKNYDENKTYILVRLSESFSNAIQEYSYSLNSSSSSSNSFSSSSSSSSSNNNTSSSAFSSPTIQFNGSKGSITFPNGKSYEFSLDSDGTLGIECIEQTHNSWETIGKMACCLQVKGKDDVYNITRQKMAAVEQERRKYCTKFIGDTSPQDGSRSVKRSKIDTNNTTTNGNNQNNSNNNHLTLSNAQTHQSTSTSNNNNNHNIKTNNQPYHHNSHHNNHNNNNNNNSTSTHNHHANSNSNHHHHNHNHHHNNNNNHNHANNHSLHNNNNNNHHHNTSNNNHNNANSHTNNNLHAPHISTAHVPNNTTTVPASRSNTKNQSNNFNHNNNNHHHTAPKSASSPSTASCYNGLSEYSDINDLDQLRRYKIDFDRDHAEYIRLHEYLHKIEEKFTSLKESLAKTIEGSSEWEFAKDEIFREYDKVKGDIEFHRARSRYSHLHKKLAHIKDKIFQYKRLHKKKQRTAKNLKSGRN